MTNQNDISPPKVEKFNLQSRKGKTGADKRIALRADLSTIAGHEAAHGVMRYLVDLRCTRLTADENGGFCYGSGEHVGFKQDLLVTLAGIASEAGCIPEWCNLGTSQFHDLEKALRDLTCNPYQFGHLLQDGKFCIPERRSGPEVHIQ